MVLFYMVQADKKICIFEHMILDEGQWLCWEKGDILVILIIAVLLIIFLQHELRLFYRWPFLWRLDIKILDNKWFLLLGTVHLPLLAVVEGVGGVQGAQVLRPAGLEAGEARVRGEGLVLESLHHEGGWGPDLGVNVRLLIVNGTDLVVGDIILVISQVLHGTQKVPWQLLSFLHNRNKILCRKS